MNNCKHGKTYYLYKSGYHIGLYCDKCNKWIKWVSKKEVPRLIEKGVKVYGNIE